MQKKKRVVIGLVGSVLDAGQGPARWEKWRPTVSLCQQEDFLVDRFELLYQVPATKLADLLAADIKSVSPETEVRNTLIEFNNAWDFEEVYGALHEFARSYPFNSDAEEYLVHITTGTHVAQICLFLLTEARYFPAKLVQSSPPRRDRQSPGELSVIDLDLSRYDKIATRFQREIQETLTFLKFGIPTRNRAFNQLIENIERVAIRSKAPVLVMGQTGAGIHQPNRHYLAGAKTDTIATHAAALEYVDRHIPRLISALTRRAPVFGIICSDHGTAYGEDGYSGHRLAHPVVWEVPYVEFVLKEGQ